MLLDITKQQRWEMMHERVLKMTDRLGKEVDAGIKDTVIVLNLLGIPTIMSCEGHMEGTSGAPWVDIEDQEAAQETEQVTALFKRATEAYRNGLPSDNLFAQAHEGRLKALKKQLAIRKKLMDYLIDFYQRRHVDYDVRIIIRPMHAGACRIESQGAGFQEVVTLEERASKLVVYQGEMQAFTEFLKRVYFEVKP